MRIETQTGKLDYLMTVPATMVKPGTCFIHDNNSYLMLDTSEELGEVIFGVNLNTGEKISLDPVIRVVPLTGYVVLRTPRTMDDLKNVIKETFFDEVEDLPNTEEPPVVDDEEDV